MENAERLVALAERAEALEAELAEARRAADATAIYLERFDADTATLELKSDAFRLLAELAYSYGEACGMENYVEATVKVGPLPAKDGRGEFVVTLQRLDGKTPHALRAEAEQERDALREQVEALTVQLEEEERMVKWLREAVLGAPKGVVLGDVSRGQRYLGTWQGPNLPEDWTVGTKVALVRLTPDGLGLAGTTKHTEHTEEGVKA